MGSKWVKEAQVLNFKRKEEAGARWWPKRLLNFPPPVDPPDTKLHTELFPLREIQKLAEWHLCIRPWENTSKWGRKDETHSHHKPLPWHSTTLVGWNPQFHFIKIGSPWVAKSLDHTCSAPTFKASIRGSGPKWPSSDSQRNLHSKRHKTTADTEAVFKQVQETPPPLATPLQLIHLGSAQREQAKMPIPQFPLGRV